ncbi:proteophosphoglycan ppg4, partial [Trypanosoma vivax Y486]
MACSALSMFMHSVRFLSLSNEADPPLNAVILTKVPRCTVFCFSSSAPVSFRSRPPFPAWPLAAMARSLHSASPAEAVTSAPILSASGLNCGFWASSFIALPTVSSAKGFASVHLAVSTSAHALSAIVLAFFSSSMVPCDIGVSSSMQLNDCPACTLVPSAASAETKLLSEPLPTVSARAAFAAASALFLSSLSAVRAPFPCSALTAATTDSFLPSSGAAKLAANEASSFTLPAVAASLSASCAKLLAYLPANLNAPAYLHRPAPLAVCSPFGAAASQAAAASANKHAAMQQSFPILYSFAPCANRPPKEVQCCGFSAVPFLAREQNSIPPPLQAPRHV